MTNISYICGVTFGQRTYFSPCLNDIQKLKPTQMNCKQLLAYRYIIGSSPIGLKIGDVLPIPNGHVSTSIVKRNLEDLFEDIRAQMFPHCLSRKSSLYVIPPYQTLVDNWLKTVCRKQFTSYYLLTLELTGNIEWHDSQYFTLAGGLKNQSRQLKLAFDYWMKQIDGEKLDETLPEGLFIGTATIIKIEHKSYPHTIKLGTNGTTLFKKHSK